MREQTRSNWVEKLLFQKLSLKDNLHNTKNKQQRKFAEFKRTIELIY